MMMFAMVDHNRRPAPASAFTMLELAVVITILGTLALIAVPRYANFLAEQRVDAAARRLAADLAYAQRSARMSSRNQTVRFNVSGDSYTLEDLPDPDHAGADYGVVLRKEPYGAAITSVSLGGDTDVIFDGYGIPVSGGGGTIQLRVGNTARTVSIDAQTGQTEISRDSAVVLPPPPPPEAPELPVSKL